MFFLTATIVHLSPHLCVVVHTISHFCLTIRDKFRRHCAWLCAHSFVRLLVSSFISLLSVVLLLLLLLFVHVIFISSMYVWYTLCNKTACSTYCTYGYQFNLTSGALSRTRNNSGKMISFMNNLQLVCLYARAWVWSYQCVLHQYNYKHSGLCVSLMSSLCVTRQFWRDVTTVNK